MKTIKIIFGKIACLLAVLCLFYSCNIQESNESKNIEKPQTLNPVLIGEQHNQGLSLIFDALNNAPKTRSGACELSDDEILDIMNSTMVEYVSNVYELDESETLAVEEVLRTFLNDPNMDDTFLEGLSSEQLEFYEELETIMTDSDDDLYSLLDRLSRLADKTEAAYSDFDQEIMLCAISVASNSLQYWYDNYVSWNQLLDGNDDSGTIEQSKKDWKEAGQWDVKAISLGFNTTGALGLLFGATPAGGALLAGIAGVAVLASGYDLIFNQRETNTES